MTQPVYLYDKRNPAQKLRHIIHESHRVPKTLLVKNGWAKVFQVRADDWIGLLNGISQCLSVVDECIKLLHRLRGHEGIRTYSEALQEVKHLLTQFNFRDRWTTVLDVIGEDTKTYTILLLLEDKFDEFAQSYDDSTAKYDEMTQKLDALAEQIVRERYPKDLQDFLLEQINIMRDAVKKYRLYGEDVYKDVATVTGRFMVDPRFREYQSYWDRPLVKAIMNSLMMVAALSDIAQGVELGIKLIHG